MPNEISVIGAGYVGLTTAVLLAESGFRVHLIDVNSKRISAIKKGRSFFFEAGINPLIKHSLETGLLIPTLKYKEAIENSKFIFSCVGTPDNPDGSSNLNYVFDAAKEAAKFAKPASIYIQKSTVPVGTGAKVQAIFTGLGLSYVSNPEFLREGTAILDSLWPDRIVVGSADSSAAQKVIGLYKKIERSRAGIIRRAQLKKPDVHHKQAYFKTSLESAELIKVTANAFLALKISFANSIAKLADQSGADVNEVMDGAGSDVRIGRAFLNAGRGYGGGCFPKDVTGLISSAAGHGVDLAIMSAASELNESMPGYIVNKAKKSIGSFKGKKVAVLGLAFKSGTSDARKSPGVKIANILSKEGAKVTVYDPQAIEESKEDLRKNIKAARSIGSASKSAAAVFVATDWPEFLKYSPKSLSASMAGNLFVDCTNSFLKKDIKNAGLEYIGVGR